MLDPVEVRDPESEFVPPDMKGIAVAVTMTTQISERRSIVLQTYMDRDLPADQQHQLLDKIGALSERQEAKAQIDVERRQLEIEQITLHNMKEDIVGIEQRSQQAWENSRKKGSWPGPTAAELAQKTTAMTNIKRYEDAISRRQREIARLEAIIDASDIEME